MTIKKIKRWIINKTDSTPLEEKLTSELNINPVISKILINRGIDTIALAEHFINPSLEFMYDPFLMKDMDKACKRILTAFYNHEKICIYGDFDVDGVTSSSLFKIFFSQIGIDVDFYIPNRIKEGYGVNIEALRNIKERGFTLVITVDCGITSVEEVKEAKSFGLEIIVTDHHQVPDILPDACAVLNPAQKDCEYPNKNLCGAGVAYKFIKAIRKRLRDSDANIKLPNLKRHLDLVAIGSVADIVPLVDENRILVKHGLLEIEKTEKIGLQELKNAIGINNKAINTYDIGFQLAPRINAAGRIADPKDAVTLLTSDDRGLSKKIAYDLDISNRKRQLMQNEIFTEAKYMVDAEINLSDKGAIILASENWHPGIIGIVASKLIELFYKPVILISLDGEEGRGSARSIPHFHIQQALKKCETLLAGFGGHKMAAGLTIETKNIEQFKDLFNKIVREEISDEHLVPELKIDSELHLSDLNFNLLNDLENLQPFGYGNPQPIFTSKSLIVKNEILIGKERNHIKFKVKKDSIEHNVIGFNMAYIANQHNFYNGVFDIAYTVQKNEWNGNSSIQLILKDIKASVLEEYEG